MTRYAENTTVSADKSRAEIESLLARYGASSFAYAWETGRSAITFAMAERFVRFVLELPDATDREFTHTPSRGTKRSDSEAYKAWEQATRSRWRSLCLVIKAKLEAVEANISCFEDEFGMNILLPDGTVVGDHVRGEIASAYRTGQMPSSLLAIGTGS